MKALKYLSIIAVAVALPVTAYLLVKTPGEIVDKTGQVVDKIGAAVRGLFGSKVSITSTSQIMFPETIAELALVQRTVAATTKYQSNFLGYDYSTLVTVGTYRIKVGIELDKATGRWEPDTQTLYLDLPEPKVLSFETIKQEHIFQQVAMTNPLEPEETQAAHNANVEAAKKQASDPEILSEAALRMEERISDAFRGIARRVIVNKKPIDLPLL